MAMNRFQSGFDTTSTLQYARHLSALIALLELIEDPSSTGTPARDSQTSALQSALQQVEAHPEQGSNPVYTFLAAVDAASRMLIARYPQLNAVGAATGAPAGTIGIREQHDVYAPDAGKDLELASQLLDELRRQREGLERMAPGT